MCFGDIVESEDCDSETTEKVAAEDDEGPEWELRNACVSFVLLSYATLAVRDTDDKYERRRSAARHTTGMISS